MNKKPSVNRRLGRFAAILAVSALALGIPAAAQAAVVENGTTGCSGKYGWVQHKVKGPTRAVLAPGLATSQTSYVYNLSSTAWTTGSHAGKSGGGYWEVYATTAIDNAYTQGLCRTYG